MALPFGIRWTGYFNLGGQLAVDMLQSPVPGMEHTEEADLGACSAVSSAARLSLDVFREGAF
jgi:hypothetical protein